MIYFKKILITLTILLASCNVKASNAELVTAIASNDIEYVYDWASQTQDIDQLITDDLSALHLAIALSRYEIIKILIKLGADVNKPSRTNQKPLAVAKLMSTNEIIQLLIDAGAR